MKMEIVDLTKEHETPYFCCLEEWSDDMKEAGWHKERWYRNMNKKGLRVKIAVDEDASSVGMIQYLPIEESHVVGRDLYFISCIWVHGHKKGVGNRQKKGIGKALLVAAESDVQDLGAKGIAAWGLVLPFWMKASWFRKHGYLKADRDGMASLVWKPFAADAEAPHWYPRQKTPGKVEGRVSVVSFINGWCPSQNIVYERTIRAVETIGDPRIDLTVFETIDRETFLEWGIVDGLFVDGKELTSGPPLTYEKIERYIEKRLKRLPH